MSRNNWVINEEDEGYCKCLDMTHTESDFSEKLNEFLITFDNKYTLNRQKKLYYSKKYEIWDLRFPDSTQNRGSSGGFRILFYIDIENKIIVLKSIFKRKDLDFKSQSGKKQKNSLEL